MSYEYQLIQDQMVVASVESYSRDKARKEITRYAWQYIADGPVTIKEVKVEDSNETEI